MTPYCVKGLPVGVVEVAHNDIGLPDECQSADPVAKAEEFQRCRASGSTSCALAVGEGYGIGLTDRIDVGGKSLATLARASNW
jgi:hypothetical protein